ncbi:hypothetical protein DFH27DRAFT_567786 [Peziza echinospora]|nr:hypothetical protein DFH27DRAFT_567786 [Peziza echinospora]
MFPTFDAHARGSGANVFHAPPRPPYPSSSTHSAAAYPSFATTPGPRSVKRRRETGPAPVPGKGNAPSSPAPHAVSFKPALIVDAAPAPPPDCHVDIDAQSYSTTAPIDNIDAQSYSTTAPIDIDARSSMPAPVSLGSLTAGGIERLLRHVPEAGRLVIPAVTEAEFEAWKDAADDIYSDHASHQHAMLRRLVTFRPASPRHDGTSVGDVIIQCMPSAYHESAGRAASSELQRAVRGALGAGATGANGLCCTSGEECAGFTSAPGLPPIRPTMTKIPDAAITPLQPGGPRSPLSFPTVVVEVGFSQKLAELVCDAALFNAALCALRDWFFEADDRGALAPPLVGVLDAFVHVYRRGPPPAAGPYCAETLQFIAADTPVPDVALTLTLADVYGPAHAHFHAAAPPGLQPGRPVTVALTAVAEEIMQARLRMQRRRALQRAEAVLKHHRAQRKQALLALAAVQNRAKPATATKENDGPIDGVVIGGRVLRAGVRAVLADAGGAGNVAGGGEEDEEEGGKWKALKRAMMDTEDGAE